MGLDPAQAAAIGATLDAHPAPAGAFAQMLAQRDDGKAKTRAQNRTAQRAGARAEAEVDAVCAHYLALGWADVAHVGPPVQVTGTDSRGRAVGVVIGLGPCDYQGVVLGAGPAIAFAGVGVAFEVKRSATARLRLDDRRGRPTVAPHQRAVIDRRHAAGCIAGVLVSLTTTGGPAWWWMSAAQWAAIEDGARAAGRASVGSADFNSNGTRCHMLAGGPDWLSAAVGVRG